MSDHTETTAEPFEHLSIQTPDDETTWELVEKKDTASEEAESAIEQDDNEVLIEDIPTPNEEILTFGTTQIQRSLFETFPTEQKAKLQEIQEALQRSRDQFAKSQKRLSDVDEKLRLVREAWEDSAKANALFEREDS